MIRLLFSIPLSILTFHLVSAQKTSNKFDELGYSLASGNKKILDTLASYMHDTTRYVEYYIDGRWETTIRDKSKSILEGNTLFLPTEFDSSKRYPIIEDIYAGPQDSYVPVSFMPYRSEMQSIADLGFIVVQLDGMGVANRSKAFHDVCWHNIADAGFPDRILWMKALAAKYPFADTTRVGLYGTSAGGQNALGGLLFHPEWYKAAVASCGCHDNRVDKQWWNEQWMGYPIGPWYATKQYYQCI